MIVVICGSRSITDIRHVEEAVEASRYDVTHIISGCARGVDSLALDYAFKRNIPVSPFPVYSSDWKDRDAGLRRNKRMVDQTEGVIAVWDGKSRGTWHTISYARQQGKLVYVHRVPEEPA